MQIFRGQGLILGLNLWVLGKQELLQEITAHRLVNDVTTGHIWREYLDGRANHWAKKKKKANEDGFLDFWWAF